MVNQHEIFILKDSFNYIRQGKQTFVIVTKAFGKPRYQETNRKIVEGDEIMLQQFIPCLDCKGRGRVADHTDFIDCCNYPHGKLTGEIYNVVAGHCEYLNTNVGQYTMIVSLT